MTVRMAEMSMDEFRKAMGRGAPVILPIGATEGHGAHLPLSTDSLQPLAIAESVAESVKGIVAPLLPYGNCSSTRNLPGTISLDADTLRMCVSELLFELHRQGARHIVVLSGHAGASHMAALREAAKELVCASDCRVMVLSDYDIAYDLKEKYKVPKEDGHGGMIETSRIMAIAPLLARKGKDSLARPPRYRVMKNPEKYFAKGLGGYPSRATPKLGRDMNRDISSELARLVREMMEADE